MDSKGPTPGMAMTEQVDEGSAAAQPAPLASAGKAEAIRVILIEDDPNYRETLTDKLSKQGFAVRSFGDGASLLAALDAAVDADAIVVNLSLPKMSGIDLLVKLRQQGVKVPVVLLADQALQAHERLAFDRGAFDFIAKSRGVEILIGRLKAVTGIGTRTDRPQADNAVICGKLLLRPDICRAYWNQVDLNLTLGEYNIVQLLASNAGRHITYRAIYDRMHYGAFIGGDGPEGHRANVRSAIKRVRTKFRALDPTFDQIENYSTFGYCWKKPD
jgi:two-component system response regulator ChvI